MSRIFLAGIILVLALMAGGRLVHGGSGQAPMPPEPSAHPVAPAAPIPPPRTVPMPLLSEGSPPGTPNIERMARLESRRRLLQSLRYTYLDSLFTTPDSLVRRWADRPAHLPLRVGLIVPASLDQHRERAARILGVALGRWEALRLGIRFRTQADTVGAEILAEWIDRFDEERTGQADLEHDAGGVVQRARITLAIRAPDGRPLSDRELAIVATHEVGHALGLPHSGRPADVMFPTAQADGLSDRDRASATLLYSIIPGPLSQHAVAR